MMDNVIKWLKNHLPEVLILLLLVGTYKTWLTPKGYLTSGDWTFHYPDFLKGFTALPQIWESFVGLGSVDISPSFTVSRFLYGVLSNFWDYNISERILYFLPVLLFSYVGIFKLGRLIFKESNVGLFFFAIFFLFNTFILSIQTSFITYAAVYALSPLVFYSIIKLIDSKGSLKYFALSIGLLELSWLYEPRGVVALTYFLLAYLVYIIVTQPNLRLSAFKSFFAVYALLACLNLYTIIPLLFIASAENLPTTLQLFKPFNDIRDTLAFHNYSWSGNLLAPFENTPFHKVTPSFYFYIITLITFSIVFFYKQAKERRFLLFLLFTSVIGIFLLKQQNEPFGEIYAWAFEFLPSFNLFRESNKFIVFMLPVALLFGFSMKYLHLSMPNKAAKNALLFLVTALILVNLKPILTKQIGTLFVHREVPNDYLILKDFILKQPTYFRTYWVPTDSRWGINTNNHPKISGASITGSDWKQFVTHKSNGGQSKRDEISGIFKEPYGAELLSSASVKYVIVPLQDKQNDDDFFIHYGNDRQFYIDLLDETNFLERIDIGTKDLIIYENKTYKPHISTSNKLFDLDNLDNLGNEYSFLLNNGFSNTSFYNNKETALPSTNLRSLFFKPNLNQGTDSLILTDELHLQDVTKAKIYVNTNVSSLHYTTTRNSLEIFTRRLPNPLLNGKELVLSDSQENKLLDRMALKKNQNYLLQFNDKVIPVKANTESSNLGRIDDKSRVELLTPGKNLIENPSFEKGFWEQKVTDCSRYDENGKINMALNTQIYSEGKQSLQLEAIRHIACTNIKIKLDDIGNHLLSFDYQSPNSNRAGYHLQFNDKKNTAISAKLPIQQLSQWQTLTKAIDVPTGSTEATLAIYAYESDRATNNIVFYDNFNFNKTELTKIIQTPIKRTTFNSKDIILPSKNNSFEFNSDIYDGANLIANPSLEEGLWNKMVGDCNAYDNKPKLSMKAVADYKTDGQQSLQLEAIRHIACTNQEIDLPQEGDYLLSFDTQGQNTKQAGFNLLFNDDKKTTISEKIDIEKSEEWKTFKKKVRAPPGSTIANLTVYAYESDGSIKNIVRYDNFKFIKIPDIDNAFYLLTEAEQKLQEPYHTHYTSISTTKKQVTVTGIEKPFFLNFAEKYHPGWKLYLQPINEFGYLRQESLFEDKHFRLNNFANGWAIDPAYIKANYSPDYYKENVDGTIDINLVVYFKPQSYFYISLIVSGLTLVACIAYLLWSVTKERRKHYTIDPYRTKRSNS